MTSSVCVCLYWCMHVDIPTHDPPRAFSYADNDYIHTCTTTGTCMTTRSYCVSVLIFSLCVHMCVCVRSTIPVFARVMCSVDHAFLLHFHCSHSVVHIHMYACTYFLRVSIAYGNAHIHICIHETF
jgi:hypothetical protein